MRMGPCQAAGWSPEAPSSLPWVSCLYPWAGSIPGVSGAPLIPLPCPSMGRVCGGGDAIPRAPHPSMGTRVTCDPLQSASPLRSLPQPLLTALGCMSPCPTSPDPCVWAQSCPTALACSAGLGQQPKGLVPVQGSSSSCGERGVSSCPWRCLGPCSPSEWPCRLLGAERLRCTWLGLWALPGPRTSRRDTREEGTAGDTCGATRAPVQQQSCPTEPGGAPSSVLLPAPAPGSAALAGGEMGAVGLGATRLGPCQQGEGERKFWGMSGRLCPSVPCDELFGLCRHSLRAWPGCLGPVWGDSAGLGGCAGVRLVAQWVGSCPSPARGPWDPWRCPFPCSAPGR